MAIQEGAATTVGISTTLPTTFDDDGMTGYPSETYTTIGEITSIPPYGSLRNIINHLALNATDVDKRAGSRDNGNLSIPMALDDADSGQNAAEGAIGSEVAIEVALPNGEEHYFTAVVSGFQQGVGGSDSMWAATLTLAVTRPTVKVAA